MEVLGFTQYFNYIDHKGMEQMLASSDGEKLLGLARNISACLHEDWKKNLIREKGTEYQHFRPVKDDAFAEQVLKNKEEFLSKRSDDGKHLYKIIESEKNGEKTYEVQFDLIRVPFPELTTKWQEANLEAAKFALCLVKSSIDRGDMQAQGKELFDNFEKMAHDIHLEWMHREGSWAAPELMLPYEYLTVDTNGYNQKDKDRAHVTAVTAELTFQPNILARNRAIVERAITELFGSDVVDGKLSKEISKNLLGIQGLIDEQNKLDFESYNKVKEAVKRESERVLKDNQNLSFEELEKLASVYFDAWKDSVKHLGKLPKTVDTRYSELLVDDPRINHKNIARTEVKKILSEMVKEKILKEGIGTSLVEMDNSNTKLGNKIAKQNQVDYENFVALKQGMSQPE